MDEIIKVLKDIGVPIIAVVGIGVLAVMLKNYYDIKLTKLQIKQIEKQTA